MNSTNFVFALTLTLILCLQATIISANDFNNDLLGLDKQLFNSSGLTLKCVHHLGLTQTHTFCNFHLEDGCCDGALPETTQGPTHHIIPVAKPVKPANEIQFDTPSPLQYNISTYQIVYDQNTSTSDDVTTNTIGAILVLLLSLFFVAALVVVAYFTARYILALNDHNCVASVILNNIV